MVCTVRRYTGPLVRYSCTSSLSVCSPPVTAGKTTSRIRPSGSATETSAMWNRMFSLPVTRLKALISSLVTLRSARAPMRCTVAISRPTSESVTSRSRSAGRADSRVTADSGERRRRWEGDSTAARCRQEANTLGATSANRVGGRPMERIALSLRISRSIDSRLMLPGIALTRDNTDSTSSSSASVSVSESCFTRPSTRSRSSGAKRASIVVNQVSSALLRAERTIRMTRSGVGGSMCSAKQCLSSFSRTRSVLRSAWATPVASQSVSLSALATPHTRKPKWSRICLRWYSIVRPDHSWKPKSAAGTFTWRATKPTTSSGNSARPRGNRP